MAQGLRLNVLPVVIQRFWEFKLPPLGTSLPRHAALTHPAIALPNVKIQNESKIMQNIHLSRLILCDIYE